MEKLEVFDIEGNSIRTIDAREELRTGEFIKFVHVWIIDMEGNILLQKRSPSMKWGADKWATHTGLVQYQEAEVKAAIRELKEEVGIERKESELIKAFEFKLTKMNSGYGTVYITLYNGEDIKIDNDEVVDYKFVEFSDFKKIIKTKDFIFYGGSEKQNYLYYNKLFAKFNEVVDIPISSDIFNQYEVIKEYRCVEKEWKENFRDRYVELYDKYEYIIGDYSAGVLRLSGLYEDQYNKELEIHLNKRCAYDAPHFILKKLEENNE